MDCTSCNKPTTWAFELLEDVKGEGPTKRRLCFLCVQELGEKLMREHLMAPRPDWHCPICNLITDRAGKPCSNCDKG